MFAVPRGFVYLFNLFHAGSTRGGGGGGHRVTAAFFSETATTIKLVTLTNQANTN